METYNGLEFEILKFDSDDIITTSNPCTSGSDGQLGDMT